MNKLDKVFKDAKRVKINNNSKIVIMSDCHRGSSDSYDNFLKNQNIYEAALKYYYKNGFTYVELGDGDDMWEVENYKDIVNEHISSFKLLKNFKDEKRLFMVYGNHDMVKNSKVVLKDVFYKYYDKEQKKEMELLDNLEVEESLVLDYNDKDIFLLHGHQIDLISGKLWWLSRFLVRHIWKHFERFGLKDPTKAAKNYKVSKRLEKRLEKWSIKNNKILIAGHTHRPIFPQVGKSLYFNDGSCVHPNGVTCLEIEDGSITLVKWFYSLNEDNLIMVDRHIIEGKEELKDFFI